MSTISGVSSSGSYISNTTSTPKVAKSPNSGLVQTAASLAYNGNIVATLGSGSVSSLTYDAAGLLNSILQAGTSSAPAQTTGKNSSAQVTARSSTDQGIVNTLSTSASASGVYTSSGSLQGLPSGTSANWASALKANPGLASTAIADSINQGIVGIFSTTA